MNIYTTEEEQVEAIKAWFKKNSKTLAIFALSVIVVTAGLRYWADYKLERKEIASDAYQEILLSVEKNNIDTGLIKEKTEFLQTQYSSHAYSALASLIAAEQLNNGSLKQTYLNWVVENSQDANLKAIAQVRLARAHWNAGDNDKAIELLESVDQKGFDLLAIQTLGDIYLSMGEKQKARDTYTRGIEMQKSLGREHGLLTIKLNNVRD